MTKIRVLTTSPSIETRNNVSGIANLTRLWIENNKEVDYFLFTAGKKDKTVHNLLWFIQQPFILIQFLIFLIKHKKTIDIIHINYPLEKLSIIRDTSFIKIASLIKKPILIHFRGGIYSKNEHIPFFYKFLINISIQKAKQIIFLGEGEKSIFTNLFKIDHQKLSILPNCVYVPEYIMKSISGDQNIVILFLGRLDKNKGLNEIIIGLSKLPFKLHFTFKIAGEGPEREWFISSCQKFLYNKFQYLGVVSGLSKIEVLKSSHIFLLPSYYEGLPNALLEAMSYGLVPIVTSVGSIPEVVTNLENGLIIPVKDGEAIHDAILSLISNPDLFIRLSNNAYKRILTNYSLNDYLNKLNKKYLELIEQNY